jgi:glycosyltransferase involved in cell wall biosynthesis
MPPVVCILGRFPPPIDGQSMLTEQMARQLEDRWKVQRINTAVQTETHTRTDTGWNSGVAKHYLRLTRHTRSALAAEPNAPVIWHSISPMPLGHFRDLLTIIPAFQSTQKVYAVIHWGNFDRLFRSRLTRFTAKRLVRRLSGFVFLDDCLSKNCEAWIPPEKRFTIPNNIDNATRCTQEEIADKQSRRVKRESLRLLFLSNMIPSKGYLDVLHAVKILHAEGLPLHADFIGRWQSDEDQKSFMNYVAEHKLENVITAHGGIQDRARIKQLISRPVRIAEDTGSAKGRLWVFAGGDELCHIRHKGLPILQTVRPADAPEVFLKDLQQTEMSESCEQHTDSDIRRVGVDDDTCEMFGRRLHRSPASRPA